VAPGRALKPRARTRGPAAPRRSLPRPTLLTPARLRRWPIPRPDEGGGKRDRGTVLVVAGARQTPGAAILAATATLRAGAGTLQIATAASVAAAVGSAVPEALVIPLPESASGAISPRGYARLKRGLDEAHAVLFGPGLLDARSAAALLAPILAALGDAVLVLDAGGLAAASSRARAVSRLSRPAILTRHEGEMAKLLRRGKPRVAARRVQSVLEAARLFRAVAVLKGAQTLIASPDGELFVNRAGNPGLATSGSGDTLAGVVAGLAARGVVPLGAAAWGVHVHAKAGDRVARRVAPLGFLARELLGEIPSLIAGR